MLEHLGNPTCEVGPPPFHIFVFGCVRLGRGGLPSHEVPPPLAGSLEWRLLVSRGISLDHMITNQRRESARFGASDAIRGVNRPFAEVSLAWQELIDRAREDGTVRSDATVKDLRFLFASARAADEVAPGGSDRVVELLLEALRK